MQEMASHNLPYGVVFDNRDELQSSPMRSPINRELARHAATQKSIHNTNSRVVS